MTWSNRTKLLVPLCLVFAVMVACAGCKNEKPAPSSPGYYEGPKTPKASGGAGDPSGAPTTSPGSQRR